MRKFAVMAAVVLAVPAFAQEAPKPGKEHEALKKYEGKWDTTMKMGDAEEKGTATYKMERGGFWLDSTFEGKLFNAPFTGKGTDGYCPIKKKYVSFWTDSMSSSPVVMEGTLDADKKTMTMTGEGPGQDGKVAKYKSVTTWKDDDTFTMSMYMGDAKEPAFSVTYKRAKK